MPFPVRVLIVPEIAGIVIFQPVDISARLILQSFYAAAFAVCQFPVEPGDFLDPIYMVLFMFQNFGLHNGSFESAT